jgi:archaellum component FlaD/FlaE
MFEMFKFWKKKDPEEPRDGGRRRIQDDEYYDDGPRAMRDGPPRGRDRDRRPPRDMDSRPRDRDHDRGRPMRGRDEDRRRGRPMRERGEGPPGHGGQRSRPQDLYIIRPDGPDRTHVERKEDAQHDQAPPKPPAPKTGKYEIAVGSPALSGEGTTGGVLQSVLKPNVTEGLKSGLKEARLSKVESTITDMQSKLQNLEETTNSMKGELTDIKETVSRMEIAMNDVEDIREEFTNMEKSLRELSALYDLLSGYTNPFIDAHEIPKREPEDGSSIAWDAEKSPGQKAAKGEIPAEELDGMSKDVNPFVDDVGPSKARPADAKMAGPAEQVAPPTSSINRELWMLKWAKYLSEKVRPSQVPKLLRYYKELDWIDGAMEEKMLTYLEGSRIQGGEAGDEDTIITEDGKVMTSEPEDGWKMNIEDHSRSLEFIGKIKSDSPP